MFQLGKSENTGGHSDRYRKLKKSYREKSKKATKNNYGNLLTNSENKQSGMEVDQWRQEALCVYKCRNV